MSITTRTETYKALGLTITREWELCCDDHGVIGTYAKYHDAIMARRDHYFDEHTLTPGGAA